MNSENEFREILGDKLNQKQFSFDSAAWEQARDLIDATREKKRRRPLLWLFFGLLVILSGTGAFFMLHNSENKLAQHASNEPAKESVSILQNEANMHPENNSGRPVEMESGGSGKTIRQTDGGQSEKKTDVYYHVKNTEGRSDKKDNANDLKAKNKILDKEKTATHKVRPVSAIATVSAKTKGEENKIVHNSKGEITVAAKKKSRKNEAGSAIALTKITGTKENKNRENNNENEGAKIAGAEKARDTKQAGEGTDSGKEKENGDQQMNGTAANGIQADTATTLVSPEPFVNAALTKTETVVSNENVHNAKANEPLATAISDSIKTAAKVDSASASNALPSKPKDPEQIISAEAGALYLYGWQNPGVRDANGYNPYLGVNYATRVYRKFWLSSGLGYYSVRNLSYSGKTSKVTRLGLGEESAVTVITPSTLHYAAFTLKLSYDIDKNNSIAVGYYYSWLFDVAVKKETYQYHSGAVSNDAVSRDHGYIQGFRRADNLLSAYYRRRIWKQISANAEFVFGLNDVKDNAFFNSRVYERNFGFKCSIIYDIIRK